MARTLRRQPIQLSTKSSDYPQSYYFNQAEFKGIYTSQNDITVDQQTFADAQNMCIDADGVLTSRLPFKFDGDECYITDRWDFGRYHLTLQRLLCEKVDDTFVQTDDKTRGDYFVFKLTCFTSTILDMYTWSFSVDATGFEYFPEVTCAQVEDKIFVWFAGIDFIAFNTVQSVFEDADRYIYSPVRYLVTNGIAAEFETENFLTRSYRRRHQLSMLSGVDYPSLYNKQLSVYSESTPLYDVQLKAGFESVLIHPSFYLGNYYMDFVETARGLVILRYDIATRNISVSFGTGVFHNIPHPNKIIVKEPVLTRDGLGIVVYTYSYLYMYDLSTTDVSNGSWTSVEYGPTMSRAHWTEEFGNKDELSGYFETTDVYAFTGRDFAGDLHIYSRVSDGANGYIEKDTLVGDTNLDLSFYKRLRLTGDLTVINDEVHVSLVGVHKNTNVPRILICAIPTNTDAADISEMPCNYELNTNLSDCGFVQLGMYNVLFSGNFDVDGVATDMYFYRIDSSLHLPLPPIQVPIVSKKFVTTADYKCITDKYIWDARTGYALMPDITTDKDVLSNGDRLTIGSFSANVYSAAPASATSDITLSSTQITSGGLIFWAPRATATEEYLEGYGDVLNVFSIERLSIEDGEFAVSTGEIRSGDFVRLTAVTSGITDRTPYRYPATPSGWQVGDDWPDTFPPYKPLFVEADNSTREWEPGDALPEGPITIYGNADVTGDILPLYYAGDTWYNIGGRLWTSALQEDTLLEIDEYVNGPLNLNIPTNYDVMNAYYFSYNIDNEHLLEVTETRRDDATSTNLLLYLPKKNEQKFSSKITALHHLSDSEMGIFTENDIWYVSVSAVDNTIVYTKPILSKIPTGLRDGDGVVTALDGQAIIFPSERGIVALAPQDFIATTEKTLGYLSDNIQSLYQSLYENNICIDTYKYWLLFYGKFGRDILVFDTRNASWWKWTVPYPIRSLMTKNGLQPLLQIDFVDADRLSLLGVPYILRDDITYTDDVVEDTLRGDTSRIYENEQVGEHVVRHKASSAIDWWFTSQRLHFNQINNYKSIKAINMSLKGDTVNAKMYTKAFRDLSHPEQDDVVEIKINELRTFVKRFNLLHLLNFQYRVENDRYAEVPQPFKLNSLSIKYEVKERVR